MRRVQADDPSAFGELYDRHAGRAWSVARAICHDAGRAEDAVQEGFLAVWRTQDSYRSERGSVQAWLMTIVRNRAIDATRREPPPTVRRSRATSLSRRRRPQARRPTR
jgi:RNA polymerase sigma-70 factor, ECF subfamily